MSVGFATLHGRLLDAEDLIRQADAALYEHKRRPSEPRDALAA
jgi:GGDEF domain-containing protein